MTLVSAHYQALVIQKQSDSDIATQLSILCELAKVNMDFVIKSSFRPGPRCLITWGAGVETLYNAVDQDFSNPRRFNAQLASKMVRALQRLHETVEGPLCFFEIPGKSLQSQHWLVSFYYLISFTPIRISYL